MIQVFYTGGGTPRTSLGGAVSSTPVPNGRLNNLFEDVAYMQIAGEQLHDCKAIVLKNGGSSSVTAKIGVVVPPGSDFTIELAIVTLNNGVMEGIANCRDLPYIGTFFDATVDDTDPDPFSLPTLAPDQAIGLWVKRLLHPEVQPDLATLDVETINPQRAFHIKLYQ